MQSFLVMLMFMYMCMLSLSVRTLMMCHTSMHHSVQHSVGGRITVFQSCLPNTGPGALKYRDVTPSSVKMVRIP